MAASGFGRVNDKGVWRYTGSVQTNETPLVVYVGHLRDVTIQTRRSAGAGSDTLAVEGSNDGTNFAAVTSTTQSAGGDTALSALTNSTAVHTLRQKVEYLRFTPSGDNDTFEVIVSGVPATR